MDISLVPVGHVAGFIPALLPYLQKTEEWTKGRSKVDDVLRMILNGQLHLWVVYEGERIYGHVTTEVKQYARCKMLTIQYCAMEPGTLDQINDKMQTIATQFAKDAGCAGIEFVGRPGWRKTASEYGYSVQSVMYQKFFEDTP